MLDKLETSESSIITNIGKYKFKKIKFKCKSYTKKFSKKIELTNKWNEMSDEMSDLYQIPRSEICTVYNPIDIDQIGFSIQETFETPSDYIKYVAVGRVQPQKDYTTLLQAFAKVLQRQPKSILFIVGDDKGEYASRQKVLMSELGISNNVFFEGFQANPYKYIYIQD